MLDFMGFNKLREYGVKCGGGWEYLADDLGYTYISFRLPNNKYFVFKRSRNKFVCGVFDLE